MPQLQLPIPQLQLPIFPAGITEINKQIAVEKREGMVYYVHGHLPVFQHGEGDVRAFRMFTSQMNRFPMSQTAERGVQWCHF
jgi:hypothetical protein